MARAPQRKKWDYDCAIIGGGPGGLVSAIYLRRFRREVVILNSGKPRVAWGPRIRNLIGHDKGIPGHLLLKRLATQIEKLGKVHVLRAEGVISRDGRGFRVRTGKGDLTARKVIVATGITDRQPDIANLEELRQLGLLRYCSICDGFESREKPVGVLADDDSGLQKAVFIGHWTKRLQVVIPRGLRVAPARMRELKKVRARLVRGDLDRLAPSRDGNSILIHVRGRPRFLCSVVYVELGCRVNDAAFRDLRSLRRTKEGFLITTSEQRTSVPGLFAVGDCVNQVGQVSVAAGQAAIAATTIHNDLLEEDGR